MGRADSSSRSAGVIGGRGKRARDENNIIQAARCRKEEKTALRTRSNHGAEREGQKSNVFHEKKIILESPNERRTSST